jgi:hypothetical protein
MWHWSVVILLLLVIGGVVVGVLAGLKVGVFKKKKTGEKRMTITSTATTASGNKSINKSISTDCRAPTAAELAAHPSLSNAHMVCEFDPQEAWVRFDDDSEYQFVTGLAPLPSEGAKPLLVYTLRGANDLRVNLTNISGSFHSMVLQFEDDFFGRGFSKAITKRDDDATEAVISASVNAMILTLPKAHVLVGDAADSKGCEAALTFEVRNPKTFAFTPLPATVDAPVLTGDRLNGAFRLALDHLDYHFSLAGQDCRIRILLGRCHDDLSLMAVKQVYSNGVYQYYDPVENKLTETANENVWSFWNQGKYLNPGNDGSEDTKSLPLRSAFKAYRVPMPLDIMNPSVDFAQFQTRDVTLTLLVGGTVGFRDAVLDGLTEAQLAAQPMEQLKRFDLDNLQLQALFGFSPA